MLTRAQCFLRSNREIDYTNVKAARNTISKSSNKFSSSNEPSDLFSKRQSVNSKQFENKRKLQSEYSPEINLILKSFPANYDKNKCRPNSLPLSIERKQQDKFFLYLFLTAILISAYTLLDAKYFKKSNINLILNGYDTWGNICGQNNKEIANAKWSGQNMSNRKYMLLRLGRNFTINSICIENCTFNDYFKIPFNRCLPKPLLLNPMFSMINITKNFFDEIIIDSLLCWREIIVLCSISISFSFALLISIGFFVVLFIWIIFFIFSILIILITIYFWSNWYTFNGKNMVFENETIIRKNRMMLPMNKSQENLLLLSIFSTLFGILVILIIIYLKKNFRLVSLVFKEASKATAYMPSLLLLPFLTLITLLLASLYATLTIIYINSDQYPIVRPNSTIVDYKLNTTSFYLIWLNFAIFIWICHFIYACQHYITSASISKWYFKRNKKLRHPILSSMIEMIRFHVGSLAFGSLIVTGVKVFRILISKFKPIDKEKLSLFDRIINLFVTLFEKLVIFINKNAYIIIALHGTNFRTSSKTAFNIILSKSVKIAIINLAADFILLVAKILIVLITLLVGIELIRDKEEKLNYFWGPLLLPAIFSYFIAHCFLTIYEMIIDTLFVCLCEDSKLDEIESQSSQSSNSLSNNDPNN